jgi:hypothetical protein
MAEPELSGGLSRLHRVIRAVAIGCVGSNVLLTVLAVVADGSVAGFFGLLTLLLSLIALLLASFVRRSPGWRLFVVFATVQLMLIRFCLAPM